MADDLGTKVDLILNKLRKLDSIELRLENLNNPVAKIEQSQNVQAEKTKKTSQRVNDLEKGRLLL